MSDYSNEKKDKIVDEIADEVSARTSVLQSATTLPADRELLVEYANEYNPNGLVRAYEEDKAHYPIVKGKAPWVTYLFLLTELAERGSYYGITGLLANFIQRPLPTGSTTGKVFVESQSAGALGLGLQTANAFTMLLQFLAYVTPLFGGYLADSRWGRYKTICLGVFVGLVSHIIFIIAGLPTVIAGGHALAPTIIAILTLAVGTGCIKANLLPLFLDQYPYETDVLMVLKDGTVAYIDREASMGSMTLFFYWAINIGAFLQLATSYCERRVGFWLAFMVPGLMYLIVCFVIIFLGKHCKKEIPQGSILSKFFGVLRVCFKGNFIKRLRNGTFWEYSFPSEINKRNGIVTTVTGESGYKWTDQDVRDYKLTLSQCVLFLYFVFFNLNDNGLSTALTSQAGSMTTKGVPNDLFNNFNQITIIVLIPILEYIIYPLMRRWNIPFRPVWKITFGFILAASSSVASAVIQYQIYQTSPCGYYATDCDEVSPMSAWIDVSVYVLAAAGECFSNTVGYELAYTRAPENSKGLVMALFLFMTSLSSAISEAVSAALIDPHLIWPFAAIAIAGAVAAVAFLIQYWNLHKVMAEEERLRLEAHDAAEAIRKAELAATQA
ncbi:hypothetical protein CANARDRAFT_28826 [[Candida] arabinofermentans NRRL YB-2248]|uniref:Peptide transporter PTR2 n=1 Tax=[Candida] arabinofermentans NRRL YB-2248 TaxID=983967 RepID=A0A1E4SYS4_9ASCO|nr:hypothetical protein CANARDRAFT_28826 [[Candida] arabinofermentans NRRL YB-2248]